MHVLGAVLRLVDPADESTSSSIDLRSAKSAVNGAWVSDVGLALQASLRDSLQSWVTSPNVSRLRRYLQASGALLDEIGARDSLGDRTDDRMMRAGRRAGIGSWDIRLARTRACVRALARDAARWLVATPRVSRRDAENLAWRMQNAAAELFELAGRGNAHDDRQADWLALVAEPHNVELDRDDHACALIGAACWHDSGEGRLADWQAMAWRLWSLSPRELSETVAHRTWLRLGRRGLSLTGQTLVAIRAATANDSGQFELRPRAEAAAAALKILQARRCDAEVAIQLGNRTQPETEA